jgi:hypothetical protein
MQAMVTQAAQVEATRDASRALVHAYLGLRAEMLEIVESHGLKELQAECERLFPPIEEASPFNPTFDTTRSHTALVTVASEAQMGLRKLQGWIQGLIDELTFSERLRLDAAAKAAQANRPPTGFQKP